EKTLSSSARSPFRRRRACLPGKVCPARRNVGRSSQGECILTENAQLSFSWDGKSLHKAEPPQPVTLFESTICLEIPPGSRHASVPAAWLCSSERNPKPKPFRGS